MNIAACKKCKKLFDDILGYEICPECRGKQTEAELITDNSKHKEKFIHKLKEMEKEELIKFEELKEYVLQNPKANVMQISAGININPSLIFKWVKEGRLEFSDESRSVWFTCEKCGTKIKSGRFCSLCK